MILLSKKKFFFKKIDLEIRKTVDEGVQIAKAEKEVDSTELTADIYSEPLENEIRGAIVFNKHPHLRIGKAVNK